MRRGTKEMDIILMRYADARLAHLDAVMLDDFEALLAENDQDLYQWVTGQLPAPARFTALMDDISRAALSP